MSASALAQQQCDADTSKVSMPAAQFEDHGDGTVSDRVAKLMWTKCLLGQTWQAGSCRGRADRYAWAASQEAVAGVNRSGSLFFNDWRLPSLRELAMITERACSNPRTNLAVFPDTPSDLHWTSSLQPGGRSDASAYALSFGSGGVQLVSKDQAAFVRLVRNDR